MEDVTGLLSVLIFYGKTGDCVKKKKKKSEELSGASVLICFVAFVSAQIL